MALNLRGSNKDNVTYSKFQENRQNNRIIFYNELTYVNEKKIFLRYERGTSTEIIQEFFFFRVSQIESEAFRGLQGLMKQWSCLYGVIKIPCTTNTDLTYQQ